MNMKVCTWLTAAALLAGCGDDDSSSTTEGGSSGGTTDASTSASTTDASTTDASTTGGSTTDASTTAGTTTDASTTDDSGTGGSSGTGGATFTITGSVSRSVSPAMGQDGIGTIYIGALVQCNQTADSAASTEVANADLSDDAASVDYTITDVPAGTYYITAFMDDDGNTDPDNPDACAGDLATGMAFPPGPICVEVTVGPDATGADIDLNIAVPAIVGC